MLNSWSWGAALKAGDRRVKAFACSWPYRYVDVSNDAAATFRAAEGTARAFPNNGRDGYWRISPMLD